MSFLTYTVPIPVWLLVLMIAVMIPSLVQLARFIYQFKRGDLVKEEHSDMVVWRVRSRKRTAVPKDGAANPVKKKESEKKDDLVRVLKILLQEGDKGVLMQTIADRMGMNLANAQHAMQKLVNNKMVDEVVGVSGTKFYLTQEGKDYCRRKAR